MQHVTDESVERAASVLKAGGLVAFPTETVYGLGGDASSDAAVAAIYSAKGRPSFNPLIVHVASQAAVGPYGVFNDTARKLAEDFWPGPLTLVMPRKPDCSLSLLVSAGLDSVALRVPAHPVAQKLLKISGLPLAAPSANRSGRISPTEAKHVEEELGDKVEVLVDGGPCTVGVESTVLDVTTDVPVILRAGAITHEMLEKCVGKVEWAQEGHKIKSPGMMERHYAPNTKLRLHATSLETNEVLLAFGKPINGTNIVENLSPTGNLEEAAANLFRMLRVLDAKGAGSIAVMPIPETGLGIAINDRLRRAAS